MVGLCRMYLLPWGNGKLTSNVIVIVSRVFNRFLRTQPDAFIRAVSVYHALTCCEKIEVVDLVHKGVYLIVEEGSIGFGASKAPLKLIFLRVDVQAVRFRGCLSEVKEVRTETDDSRAR